MEFYVDRLRTNNNIVSRRELEQELKYSGVYDENLDDEIEEMVKTTEIIPVYSDQLRFRVIVGKEGTDYVVADEGKYDEALKHKRSFMLNGSQYCYINGYLS